MSRDHEIEREAHRRESGREYCRSLPAPERGREWVLAGYLNQRGLDPDLARANHWYISEEAGDRYTRIVIPASSELPGNLFWQARAVDKDVEPRYHSPHTARGDAVVVCWPYSPDARGFVVVEGPMDALAAAGEGFTGIALMGVTPPDIALDLTARLIRGTMALIVADSDSLGAMAKVGFKLVNRGAGVKLVSPSPYKDLAEAPREERRRILDITA